MKRKIYLLLALCCLQTYSLYAQKKESASPAWMPAIHGTIRAKYEFQNGEEDPHRFQVRNARFSLSGHILPSVFYKAEMDLSDKGEQRMLDAYARLELLPQLKITAGQMRVPFTIDAHRSPHLLYFANRSFIAKQVGSVRDVGVAVNYRLDTSIPVVLETGLFNGKGLDSEAQEQWNRDLSYSFKGRIFPSSGSNITLGMQSTCPQDVRVFMYNLGGYYQFDKLHIECEYLYKHYKNNQFANVNALNAQFSYAIPLKKTIHKISLLARYDRMDDHCKSCLRDVVTHQLQKDQEARQRVTAGVTLSLGEAYQTDIRLNYEKYFYAADALLIDPSEKDKLVIELMVRF